MAKAEINPGICGLGSVVWAEMKGEKCVLTINSECKGIQNLAQELKEVEPFQEISFKRGGGSKVLKEAAQHCFHTACPVPVGIIKAIEIAAGLALPQDVHIELSK